VAQASKQSSTPRTVASIHTAVKVDPAPVAVAPVFNAANPATWPKCAEDEYVRADNGQCAKKPAQAPVVAQATNPAPVRASYSGGDCNQWRSILAQYSWNVDVAVNVCNAESGGNPNNDNPGDYHATCYGSRGLFQIGCDSTSNYAGMFDPYANIAQAYALYSNRGWQPWGFTTCRYKVACY